MITVGFDQKYDYGIIRNGSWKRKIHKMKMYFVSAATGCIT